MSPETRDLEAKLHVLMDVAAGEPRRAVTVAAVRRRVARRRRAASATAAAAFVLVSGISVAIATQLPGHRHTPASPVSGGHSRSVTVPGPGGVPRYYVVRSEIPNNGNTANLAVTTVRATATGARRADVRCPLSAPYVITWPVAPADNQNFFLVCQRATGPQSNAQVLESRIFEFHVTSSGHVADAVPVRGGELGRLLVYSIAATPDGSKIAVIVYPGTHPPDLHATPPDVIVIDTRTGAHAIWHGAPPVSGKTVYWPRDISLTADGQRLVFLTQPQCFQTGCTIRGGQQMRVVIHPATGGGQLNDAGVLVRLDSTLRLSSASVMDAVISPDGSMLTLAVMGTLSGPPRPDSFSVIQIPAGGQGRLRIVYRLPHGGFSFLTADPGGTHFLLGTSTPNGGPLNGRISDGRLIPLRPDPVTVQDMAW